MSGQVITSAGANNTNLYEALKEFLLPRFQSTINESRVLMSRIEGTTDKTDVSGRYARFPLNIRPSQAIGARAESAALPSAQKQHYVDVQIPYKYNYATIRVSHPAIAVSRNDQGAWVEAVASEMKGIRRDTLNDYNRQLFGMGAGVLGYVASRASQVLTMVTGHKVAINMVVDGYDALSSGSQDADSVTVTAVDGNDVTVTGTVTSVDGNTILFREDAYNNEVMGLLGLVDDQSKGSGIGPFLTTCQNVDRSAFPEFNAQVMEHATPGTGRAITSDLLDEAIMEVQVQGEGETSIIVTSPQQWRKIGQLMTPDRRYTRPTNCRAGSRRSSGPAFPASGTATAPSMSTATTWPSSSTSPRCSGSA